MAEVDIRAMVREYYGETLTDSDDLRTTACTCATTAPPKYVLDIFPELDPEIIEHFYGCGSPLPPALESATVLDLGCGTAATSSSPPNSWDRKATSSAST